jgi:hypothetical protein
VVHILLLVELLIMLAAAVQSIAMIMRIIILLNELLRESGFLVNLGLFFSVVVREVLLG